jgi:hypothetical protein
LADCPLGLFLHEDRLLVFLKVGGTCIEQCTLGFNCSVANDGSHTRALVYDVAHPEHPRPIRTLEFSGSLTASRRVGARVHAVVTEKVPRIPPRPQLEVGATGFAGCWTPQREPAARAHVERLKAAWIDSLSASVKLPTVTDGGREQRLCDAVLASPQGETLTSVVTFDLAAARRAAMATTVFGAPGSVMMTRDRLFLAAPEEGRSVIHHFTVGDPSVSAQYAGSGAVRGRVPGQFALDFWEGHLRVVSDARDNSLFVLRVERDGQLRTVGHIERIAPAESLRAVRFAGDQGYVVTFRRTDPLFVVDLAEPTRPRVTGELEIPGFSTYLHRIDANTLIGTGRAAGAGGAGVSNDVGIQLFDVSDPAAPARLHQAVIEGSSPVLGNHLAFSYWPAEGVLAIPVVFRVERLEQPRDGLVLYDVSARRGFSLRETILHEPAATHQTDRRSQAVQRALLIDGRVFTIAEDRVQVHALARPSTRLADIPLPFVGCRPHGVSQAHDTACRRNAERHLGR